MHYLIISGSTRDKSQSAKIAAWLAQEIESVSLDNTTDILNIYECTLPLWNDTAWNSDSNLSKQATPYQDRALKADALIIISPEWHGMVPGGLKNLLLYLSSKHTAHKPCMLVGVSGSKGGAYPISELRMSGFKNNRMICIPDHLIVRNVENVMNDHDFENCSEDDKYIKNRSLYSLNALYAYTESLKLMREKHTLLDAAYPFGM